MTVTAVWVLVLTTCGTPGVETTCYESLVTGYTYPTSEDCRIERESLGAYEARCEPAQLASGPGGYQ